MGTRSISTILKAAKERISDPSHWYKGELGRDINGKPVYHRGPNAYSFCSAGARNIECKTIQEEDSTNIYLLKVFGGDDPIGTSQDRMTHEEVMKMWDKAIEFALKDEENVIRTSSNCSSS